MDYNLENCPITLNTTRICANNPIDVSIEVSRIGFSNMKPNAVILVNKDEIFDGIAATPLVHLPINASILFTDYSNLRKETLNEIKRLSPKGYKGIHVFLVGNISKNVSLELNDSGFKTHHIGGSNHYETACMIPCMREKFKNILIISGENYSEGIATAYWAAHHGDPILFTKKNSIPCCVLEAIKAMNDINIYIIGSTKTVSKSVENYLSKLDNVKHLDRIDGDSPYDIAVNFAKYKDCRTEFGWGRNYKEGHAFTFGELNHPMEIIAGVLFAHMGKHTPLLTIKKDKLPEVVEMYIKSVKPMPPKDMPMPPFMHGFILGATKNISYNAQLMIEDNLSIDHEMMDMKHDKHNSDYMEMHQTHHQDQMIYMEHDKCDSDCMQMHQMHHPNHMMEMEDHKDHSKCMNMHGMDHQDYMMNMKHDKCNSDCMQMHQMHHPSYMMEMEDQKDDSKHIDMHDMDYQGHMIHMKQDKCDLDCMQMHQPSHIMKMEDQKDDSKHIDMHYMLHQGHMIDMKHDKCDSDCMQMHHPSHMMKMEDQKDESKYMDMCHMPHQDHMKHMEHDECDSDCMQMHHEHDEEDEKHEEMPSSCNHKASRDNKLERLNFNYKKVSIYEILG